MKVPDLLSGGRLLAFPVVLLHCLLRKLHGDCTLCCYFSVEPEILLDGDHPIERTLVVFYYLAEKVWAEVFYYLAENKVVFEGILLKPSMVTPGDEHKEKASPGTIAKYTLTMLKRRVPPADSGIMFLSGGQSEVEATLNRNAMNQCPSPWHVSFSCACALQNTVLKTWQGRPENLEAAQSHY
ncbi:Fructose-bisphosphate aldolase [Quillaja saponaria]|uniref:Fructose-bisphosphate aldolase n=1 Tax=Quillaja saponaria TaxID=32244 RepID=A0AAD7L9Y6_QUISA|nr:Fructose-bisphosphate aldolase [Quillaja saponaria]